MHRGKQLNYRQQATSYLIDTEYHITTFLLFPKSQKLHCECQLLGELTELLRIPGERGYL